jgi:hypothetical protein
VHVTLAVAMLDHLMIRRPACSVRVRRYVEECF